MVGGDQRGVGLAVQRATGDPALGPHIQMDLLTCCGGHRVRLNHKQPLMKCGIPHGSGLLGKFGLHLPQQAVGERNSCGQEFMGRRLQLSQPGVFQVPRRTRHGPPRSRHRFEDQMVSTRLGLPARPNPCMHPALEDHSVAQRRRELLGQEGFFAVSHRCICALPWWPRELAMREQRLPFCNRGSVWAVMPGLQHLHACLMQHLRRDICFGLPPSCHVDGITLKRHGHPQARTPRRPTSQAQANALGKTPNHRGG